MLIIMLHTMGIEIGKLSCDFYFWFICIKISAIVLSNLVVTVRRDRGLFEHLSLTLIK